VEFKIVIFFHSPLHLTSLFVGSPSVYCRPWNQSSLPIESIIWRWSRVESNGQWKVESIDRVDRTSLKSSQSTFSSYEVNEIGSIISKNISTAYSRSLVGITLRHWPKNGLAVPPEFLCNFANRQTNRQSVVFT